jgi:hypothetical protein
MTIKARPLSEWSEEDGDVLWWKFPIDEPPYCGSPLDCGFVVEVLTHVRTFTGENVAPIFRQHAGGWPGYHTHWTPLEVPEEP